VIIFLTVHGVIVLTDIQTDTQTGTTENNTTLPEPVVVNTIVSISKKKAKKRIAVSGIPSHSYGTSLAIWDHTVLPATRHK